MDAQTKIKKGLINSGTGVDWSANIVTNDAAGYYLIKNTNGELLVPPILKGSILSIDTEASAAESVQYVTVADADEVIVAKARYSVSMEFPKDRNQGATHDRRIFAVNAPDTLSGTAATDRTNLYTRLVNKINAYVPQFTKAKLATLFTFKGAATVTTAGFTAGAIWYVGASYAAATWTGFVAKTTGALANATGQKVLLVTISGTFPSAPTTDVFKAKADDAVQSVADAGSTYTSGQGVVVYDQGGYFSLKDKLGRGGAPIIFNSPTFTSRPAVLQAAVLSRGIGTDMLAMAPEFNKNRDGVIRGDLQRQYTDLPVVGKTYKLYIFRCKAPATMAAIDGAASHIPVEHQLYVEEAVHATVNSTLVGLT